MEASIQRVGRLAKTILLLMLLPTGLWCQVPRLTQGVSFHQERLRVVFDSLLKLTRHQAVLGYVDLPSELVVTYATGPKRLDKVFAELFAELPMQAVIQSGRVVLQPKPVRVFTLRVLDETGAPMVGVSISDPVHGYNTTTGSDGRWSCPSWRPSVTVVLSHVQYEDRGVTLRGHEEVRLSRVVREEETVIKTGYGEATKRSITSGITPVLLDSTGLPYRTVADLLRTATGLLIRNTTDIPWGGYTIELRGSQTIQPLSAGRRIDEPLIVINDQPCIACQGYMSQLSSATGDPQGLGSGLAALAFLNVQDVASVAVLKDGLATSIYGARGAHGVILISLKKPTPGRTRFTGYLRQGVVSAYELPEVLSTAGYFAMRREAYALDGLPYDVSTAPELGWDSARDARWPRWLYKHHGSNSTAQLSATGGRGGWDWLVSANYQKEVYVYPTEAWDQWARAYATGGYTSANKKLQVQLQGWLGLQENQSPAYDLSRLAYGYPHLPTDATSKGQWEVDGVRFINPYKLLLNEYRASSSHSFGSVQVKWQALPSLWLLTNVGVSRQRLRELSVLPLAGGASWNEQRGVLMRAGKEVVTWMTEPQARWQGDLWRLPMHVTLGLNLQETRLRSGLYESARYSDDASLYRSADQQGPLFDTTLHLYRLHSVFGRVQLLPGSFLVEFAGRADGSSHLPRGRRYGYFGAGGVAWVVSSTHWAKRHWKWLRLGKLHVNYGTTGSDPMRDAGLVRPPSPAVPADAGWQRAAKGEAGLVLATHHGLRVEAVYYHHRHFNQLLAYPLAGQSGLATDLRNTRLVVDNTGWEFLLGYQKDSGAVRIRLQLSYTLPRNRLRSFDGLGQVLYGQDLLPGHALSARKLYHAEGMDASKGLFTVADLDGRAGITAADAQVIRDLEIRGYGGLQGHVVIGPHWGLGFFVEGHVQPGYSAPYYAYQFTYPGQADPYSGLSNQPLGVQNRWQPGQAALYQRLSTGADAATQLALQRQLQSDGFITDQSYVQVRQVTVEYRLASRLVQRWGLQALRFFVQGQNLFGLSAYNGGNYLLQQPYSQAATRGLSTGLHVQF